MTKRDRLNDSSMLQRRISAKTMKIDVNQGQLAGVYQEELSELPVLETSRN